VETVTAIYEHGILRPLQPLHLNESERVQIQVEVVREPSEMSAQDRLARSTLLAFAGCIHSGNTQSADNDLIDVDLTNEFASGPSQHDAS
jgi:predicted DNA-binding antitoxin AbrB/MazE fold protein